MVHRSVLPYRPLPSVTQVPPCVSWHHWLPLRTVNSAMGGGGGGGKGGGGGGPTQQPSHEQPSGAKAAHVKPRKSPQVIPWQGLLHAAGIAGGGGGGDGGGSGWQQPEQSHESGAAALTLQCTR